MGTGAASGAGAEEKVERKESEKDRRERLRQQAVMEALEDERVCDEESFHKAVAARQRRQAEDEKRRVEDVDGKGYGNNGTPKRVAPEEDRGYDVGTERARRIVRWVHEAPVGESTGTKKKRKGTKNRPRAKDDGLNSSMSDMKVSDEKTVETPEEEVD